jgi:methionyl-tRNA formyltransferase
MMIVPIQFVATEQLNLDTHVIDTFTGWTPPVPFNLVVAVSFGLLVPPRILNLAKYGGLNVHPSLLPDLRGPAPIHHALLKERPFTGISIQTLHPKHFDRGLVLAQTPSPGIPVDHDATPTGLTSILAKEGATMLVNVLKSGAFLPPLKDVGWYSDSGGPVDHAGKITKSHHEVNFDRDTVRDILKLQRVVGAPYCILPNGARLVLHSIEDAGHSGSPPDTTRFAVDETGTCPLVHMRNGDIMRINSSTYEGQKTGDGTKRLLKLIKNKTI